jgi:hypothetical protein
LLVGGLLVGCVTPQKEAKGKTEEKEKIEYPVRDWEWYVNEDRGYKLKYPEGWDVYPLNQSGTLVGIYPPENKKIDRQIVISAIDKSLLSYQSLEEKFTKTFEHEKEVASEPGREFKLLEYKNTTLGGVHAIKAKWVRANNNSRYWFGEEWFTGISAIKGKLWYSLTFMLETEKGAPLDEEWEKIIDQVIASFRFI